MSHTTATLQLFNFVLPNLPRLELAIFAAHIIEVTDLPLPLPIPHAAPPVVGVTEWRNQLIAILDLAQYMALDTLAPLILHAGDRYGIARISYQEQSEIFGFPILNTANMLKVSRDLALSPTTCLLSYGIVEYQERSIELLNLENL